MMAAPAGSQYRTTAYGGTDITAPSLSDYQFYFGGLTFGISTSYLVTHAQGLFGRPVRSQEALRPNDTGAFVNPDYPGARSIVFTIVVRTTAALLQTQLDAWQAAWLATSVGEDPLVFQLPDSRRAGNSKLYRVFGRPRRIEYDTRLWRQGLTSITAEFYCADPRIYENTLNTATISLSASGVNGVKFNSATNNSVTNWTGGGAGKFGVTFGSAPTTATGTATTIGTTTAPWYAKVAGPITNPRVTCGTGALNFDGSLDASQYIVIDSLNRNVWLNGDTASSWYSHLKAGSSWWSLPASGSSTVALYDDGIRTGSGSSAGVLTFQYRSAWL